MFITNDTADKDLAMQMAMQNYKKMLEEIQYRSAIPSSQNQVIPQHCVWDISDRD